MHKLKLFVDNFLIYGFVGIISKLIPLIMLPIIIRLMPDTSYYGLSDLSNTVVQFGSAIAVMGMYDAMYRMFFEKEDENFKKVICSTTLVFTIVTSVILFFLMLIAKQLISQYFFGDNQYTYLVYITAFTTLIGATNTIVAAPTRMQNKRKIYLITNTVSPILAYGLSIPLLLAGHYVIALPFAALVSSVTLEITFWALNKNWFSFKRFDFRLLKKMLVIGVPLLPNLLIYWIFNSSDKVMITNLMSVSAAGIYSVGSKLGHVSQLIYIAFAGGWQYFAFSTMKEEGQVKSNSLIFEYMGIISFVAGAFMCALSYPLFKLFFVGDYVLGYSVAPYLFLAPLLQMLFQIAGNQFLVIKKTWPTMLILFSGAAINVILNLILIPKLGIEGAAIATLIGYIISNVTVVAVLHRMRLMKISGRFIVSVAAITIYFMTWRLLFRDCAIIGIFLAIVLTVFFVILYRKDLLVLLRGIKNHKVK